MSRAIVVVSSVLPTLLFTSIASAQSSTETYTYDALGRLTKVETSNGSNDGVVSEIEYDDAGNRVSYDTTGVNSAPPPPPPGSAEDALEADFVGRTNSGMWDLRAATNSGSFSAANIVGGLPALTGANGATIAGVDAQNGAQFANSDQIELSATGSYAVYVLMRKDPADTSGYVFEASWPNWVRYVEGSTYLASGVDVRLYSNGAFGTPFSNRGAFHDALDDDEFHAIKIGTLTLSGVYKMGRGSSGMEADVVAVVAVDLSEVIDLQATEALIANWFNEISPSAAPPPPPPPPPPGSAEDALEADFVGRTNSGMWDLRAATNSGSFSAANIVGGLPALTGANGATIAGVDAQNGAQFANSDQIELSATGSYAVYVLMRKDPADTSGYVFEASWPNWVRYVEGSTYLASGVDVRLYSNGAFGTPFSNRGAFHDALDDDEFHAIKIGTLTLSGVYKMGRGSSGMEADVVAVVAVDLSEVIDLQATEALIANWFNEISPH